MFKVLSVCALPPRNKILAAPLHMLVSCCSFWKSFNAFN